jgi:predicted phage terminase large subunit-like protein
MKIHPDHADLMVQTVHQQARLRLYVFYHLLFHIMAPGEAFSLSPHFRALAAMLERAARGEVRRLLICIPPRHGKSMLSSVILPAWILGLDPAAKIICASYGDDLAQDFARRTRDIMMAPAYRGLFPDTVLNGKSLDELRTTAKGYRLATSVGGVLTGMGADFVIVDDPMKASDAYSMAERERVHSWIKTTVMSRFDDPKKGVLIVIAQRMHQDDLIGRLRAEGGFEVLEMPGEGVVAQSFDLGDGQTWDFKPGDILYPDKFNRQALDQLKLDLGERGYSAQVLQRPSPPGGAIFKLHHFQRYDDAPPRYEKIIQSWDPASTEEEYSSWTVCTTWGVRKRNLYLLDVFRKRLQFYQLKPTLLNLRDRFGAEMVILETSGIGLNFGNLITAEDPHWQSWLAPSSPRQDKLTRAISQTPLFEQKRIFLPRQADWLETFESEIAEFPTSKFDDQVDSTVQFLNALRSPNRVTQGLSAYPPPPIET